MRTVSTRTDRLLQIPFAHRSPAEPPAGQLRLASPTVTNFTAALLASVARMFPSGLMSTGGDELNTACYAQDAETQAELNATGRTLEEALNVFTQTTHAAIEAEGKTPAVWEGMGVWCGRCSFVC